MRLPGLTIGILAAIITVAERRMMDLVADELGVVSPSVVQKRTAATNCWAVGVYISSVTHLQFCRKRLELTVQATNCCDCAGRQAKPYLRADRSH